MITFGGVHKQFGGVVALAHVTMEIPRGSVHGLLGENGAGKSTLGKVLAGIHRPDWGTVEMDGVPRRFAEPADALAAGVGMVHQELSFCPDLTVAENLALGRWPRRGGGRSPFVDRRAMRARAEELLGRIGAEVDVTVPVGSLSVAAEQLVQIAAALGTGADVLVFDEATSALTEAEAERLYALVEELRSEGLTVIWITHRLHEVQRLCDAVSVLRDGRAVATLERGESGGEGAAGGAPYDGDAIVKHMIGRTLLDERPAHLDAEPGAVVLAVEGLSTPSGCRDVSLTVRAGEIVGLAGLVGAGRSELLRAVFGLDPVASGRVLVSGRTLGRGGRWTPRDAMAAGVGLVPEDRKRQGLVLSMGGRENVSLADLRRWRAGPFVARGRERRATQEAYQRFGVRAASVETPVSSLSGGNQQKVVLARWLAGRRLLPSAAGAGGVAAGTVLLVDEPTRGVDVGAKESIHALLSERAAAGAAILAASSDLPELLHLCDRVLVLREGAVAGELRRDEADEESVMRLMAGLATPAGGATDSARPAP